MQRWTSGRPASPLPSSKRTVNKARHEAANQALARASEVLVGLDGGLNLVSLSAINGSKNLTTWNLGFYFDIKLADPAWMVHAGVIVKSTLGTDNAPVYLLGNGALDSVFSGGRVVTRV